MTSKHQNTLNQLNQVQELSKVNEEISLLTDEKIHLLDEMSKINKEHVDKQVEGDKILRDKDKEAFNSAQSAADTLGMSIPNNFRKDRY